MVAPSPERVVFQSTPLIRGETLEYGRTDMAARHFNPLPSYEGRLLWSPMDAVDRPFQSTPLIRGETMIGGGGLRIEAFQSTPLIRGETRRAPPSGSHPSDFNPLPSYEGRPLPSLPRFMACGISIHSPHTRGDDWGKSAKAKGLNFNLLPSYEGRPGATGRRAGKQLISIHSPHTRGDAPCRR